MANKKTIMLIGIMLLLCPERVNGGPISYVSCMTAVGVGGVLVGSAILPLLGFTTSGIAAGSWAASLMATYGGAVPVGSLFATLQSMGDTGVTIKSLGGVTGLCAALTAPFP